MSIVIEICITNTSARPVADIPAAIRDIVRGNGFRVDSIETFTPASDALSALAATGPSSGRIRVGIVE